MTWTRRKLLLSGVAGTALVGAGGYLGLSALDQEGLIASMLRYHFADWKIRDADIESFSRDLLALMPSAEGPKVAALAGISPVIYDAQARNVLPQAVTDKMEIFENRVTTMFLLSTNLLIEQVPVGSEVTYNGLYDPRLGCAFPLTQPLA